MSKTSSQVRPALSEKNFSQQVEALLKLYGWLYFHARPARVLRRGEETWRTALSGFPGFPDYVAIREKGDGTAELIALELKSEKGQVSQPQREWLELLDKVPGVRAFCMRPSQWDALVSLLKGEK